MTSKLNWDELRREYVHGTTNSVADYLKQKEIKRNGNISRLTKGWNLEREVFQNQLEKVKNEEVINRISTIEAEFTARRLRIARNLQLKALRSLAHQKPKTVMQSLKMLVDGLREEREALNLNKNNRLASTGNIEDMYKIAILKTGRYGQKLLDMNYSELRDEIDSLIQESRSTVI
jgi:hypothetical protein